MNGAKPPHSLSSDIYHIAILAVLLLALGWIVMWVFGCSIIPVPGACGIYWGITRWDSGGNPKVLIVHGDDGLGNPELLAEIMQNRELLGIRTETAHLDRISLGNLQKYDLIIVEHARAMSTKKMKALVDYAVGGGRLVWTGDAGTVLTQDDNYLYYHERAELEICEDIDADWLWETRGLRISDVNCVHRWDVEEINPWARRYEGDTNMSINLDKLLSVTYTANYCQVKGCGGEIPRIGTLSTELERTHPLVYGLRADLQMYGDFAIVEEGAGMSTRILTVDYGSDLITKDNENLGNDFPVIVTSGVGEKVAYYAIPPEQFARPELEYKYYSLIENMYRGMLRTT